MSAMVSSVRRAPMCIPATHSESRSRVTGLFGRPITPGLTRSRRSTTRSIDVSMVTCRLMVAADSEVTSVSRSRVIGAPARTACRTTAAGVDPS